MTGYRINRNGRYQCLFCSHPAYKQVTPALKHIQGKHELELANATVEEMRRKLDEANNKPPKIEVREKIVYQEKPKPKYWYPTGLYCATCKVAMSNAGVPREQTIESTPHSVCGTRSLMLITEFQ